jgi:Asp/Glu/hydantoin racemase
MTKAELAADILLLNANTNHDMTDRMVARARGLAPGCRGATVSDGARYITDARTLQAASVAVLDFAKGLSSGDMPDALIVACFGDPAVRSLRSRLAVPVVGLAEASCEIACRMGQRFGIVTGGTKWPPLLRDLVEEIGLSPRLSGIHALDVTGDRVAQDPEAALEALRAKISEAEAAGADVVVLGGAGLTGLTDTLAKTCSVPLIDSVDCAVVRAIECVAQPMPGESPGEGG